MNTCFSCTVVKDTSNFLRILINYLRNASTKLFNSLVTLEETHRLWVLWS